MFSRQSENNQGASNAFNAGNNSPFHDGMEITINNWLMVDYFDDDGKKISKKPKPALQTSAGELSVATLLRTVVHYVGGKENTFRPSMDNSLAGLLNSAINKCKESNTFTNEGVCTELVKLCKNKKFTVKRDDIYRKNDNGQVYPAQTLEFFIKG